MTECLNETLRDRLPELAHGLLAADEAAEVRAHVDGCRACAAELALLQTSRLVLRAEAPRVDVAAIASAVTAAVGPAAPPALRVERGGAPATVRRPSVWRSRQLMAAAASLLVVASLSLPFLDGRGGPEPAVATSDTAAAPVAVAPATAAPAAAAVPSSLAVSEGLADLSADDLTALLAVLDRVEATIGAEPVPLRQPLVDAPEGP